MSNVKSPERVPRRPSRMCMRPRHHDGKMRETRQRRQSRSRDASRQRRPLSDLDLLLQWFLSRYPSLLLSAQRSTSIRYSNLRKYPLFPQLIRSIPSTNPSACITEYGAVGDRDETLHVCTLCIPLVAYRLTLRISRSTTRRKNTMPPLGPGLAGLRNL